jgi:uncharacterized membrane protein YbaN (DUF454 family)
VSLQAGANLPGAAAARAWEPAWNLPCGAPVAMPHAHRVRDNAAVDAPLPPGCSPPPSRFRWAWWCLAWTCLALGVVGLFLPVMPTTVFILLAAFAASRGSEKLHRALLSHPHFGPLIRHWRTHGAVPRHAKRLATWAMLAAAVFTITMMSLLAPGHWWLWAVPVLFMAAVAIWLWQRPEPPE